MMTDADTDTSWLMLPRARPSIRAYSLREWTEGLADGSRWICVHSFSFSLPITRASLEQRK